MLIVEFFHICICFDNNYKFRKYHVTLHLCKFKLYCHYTEILLEFYVSVLGHERAIIAGHIAHFQHWFWRSFFSPGKSINRSNYKKVKNYIQLITMTTSHIPSLVVDNRVKYMIHVVSESQAFTKLMMSFLLTTKLFLRSFSTYPLIIAPPEVPPRLK